MSFSDRAFIAEALQLARRGLGGAHPNPMVGALVVRAGTVVGRGYHARYGGAHAERVALDDAGAAAAGATMYCSLEPCCYRAPEKHQPPCTDAIIEAGIARVVIAQIDPNPRVSGGGIEALRRAGVDVELVDAVDAWRLNDAFNTAATQGRPFVHLKWAQSLDGRTAAADGSSCWITGETAREEAHRMRAACDAVVVGVGTVLADDPRLTVREIPVDRQPRAVVIDPALLIDPACHLVCERADELIVLCRSDAEPASRRRLEERGVRVVDLPLELPPEPQRDAAAVSRRASTHAGPARFSPRAILALLAAEGIRSVFIEGGARTISRFLSERCFDRISVFIAPRIIGREGLAATAELGVATLAEADTLELVETQTFGSDVLVDGYRTGWYAETHRTAREVLDVHRAH